MKLGTVVFLVPFFGLAAAARAAEITDLTARHVQGQTFLQWREDGLTPEHRVAVFTATGPIDAASIDDSLPLCRHLMPGSSCDFADLRTAEYRRYTPLPARHIRGAVVPSAGAVSVTSPVVPADRIAPRHGFYVHTSDEPRKAYYAVALCNAEGDRLSAVVPGVSALRKPVVESVSHRWHPIQILGHAPPGGDADKPMPLQVVLHAIGGFQNDRKARADLERRGIEGEHFVVYGTREHGWREGIPFHFSVYHAAERLELWLDDSNFAFMGFANSWWVGVNRHITRPRSLSFGRVHPCSENRVLAALDWVIQTYPVDADRVQLYGSSMGGTGALLLALRHPERFCAVDLGVPAVRLPELTGLRRSTGIIWGPADTDVLCSDGQSVWERVDATNYLKYHSITLPLLRISHGRNDPTMRWPFNPPFYSLLQEQGQPCWIFWDDGGHGNSSRARRFQEAYGEDLFDYARNKPLLAFANGSANDAPGSGGPDEGDPAGTLNYFYRFANVHDTAGLFRVEYWYDRDGKTDGGRVDLLPLRLQHFPRTPGGHVAFRILEAGQVVKGGFLHADARGSYRVANVPADKRYTLELRPADPPAVAAPLR